MAIETSTTGELGTTEFHPTREGVTDCSHYELAGSALSFANRLLLQALRGAPVRSATELSQAHLRVLDLILRVAANLTDNDGHVT